MRRSSGPINHSRRGPPPYSLPHIDQVSGQDDWTTAKDRTTKKRIQNRVAQRTYRQRMKERMADLQAKLADYEKEHQSRDGNDQGCAEDGSQSPIQRHDMLRSSSAGENSAALRPVASEGLSTYSDVAATTGPPEQGMLAFYTSLLADGLNGPSGTETNESQVFSSQNTSLAQDEESHQVDETDREPALSREISSQPGSFALGDGDDLTSYLSAGYDSWESSPSQQGPWRINVSPSDQRHSRHGLWILSDMDMTKPHSYHDTSRPASRPQGMTVDERIKCVLSCAETMGFNSFDELARIYYSQSFGEGSFLHGEQRLSRNRRLPGVIATVFSSATKWTPWERRGFQEEILKATEAVLISESLEAQGEIQVRIGRFVKAPKSTAPGMISTVSPLKESITSKVSEPRLTTSPRVPSSDLSRGN